jgi:hypothetical protein
MDAQSSRPARRGVIDRSGAESPRMLPVRKASNTGCATGSERIGSNRPDHIGQLFSPDRTQSYTFGQEEELHGEVWLSLVLPHASQRDKPGAAVVRCGHLEPPPLVCPHCGHRALVLVGIINRPKARPFGIHHERLILVLRICQRVAGRLPPGAARFTRLLSLTTFMGASFGPNRPSDHTQAPQTFCSRPPGRRFASRRPLSSPTGTVSGQPSSGALPCRLIAYPRHSGSVQSRCIRSGSRRVQLFTHARWPNHCGYTAKHCANN